MTSAETSPNLGFDVLLRKSIELASASAKVIRARLEMAATPHAMTPAGQAELARMIPEKTQAFSQAFDIAGQQMQAFSGHFGADWLKETSLATTAALEIIRAGDPHSVLIAQQNYLAGWCDRTVEQFQANAAALAHMQTAIIAPVHKTACENAARLTQK